MSWNYRVVKRTYCCEETWYQIHEAYYNSNGEITAITEKPVDPAGLTMDELKESLEWMQKALEKPVLDYDNIEFAEWD